MNDTFRDAASSIASVLAAVDSGQATLTPDLLDAIAEALYGPQDTRALYLAHDLGVARRTVGRWLSGKQPMPSSLVTDLALICKTRAQYLRDAAERLENIFTRMKSA